VRGRGEARGGDDEPGRWTEVAVHVEALMARGESMTVGRSGGRWHRCMGHRGARSRGGGRCGGGWTGGRPVAVRDGEAVSAATTHGVGSLQGRSLWWTAARGGARLATTVALGTLDSAARWWRHPAHSSAMRQRRTAVE
jgi:hypothetical protein